jgi:hypothetical protein
MQPFDFIGVPGPDDCLGIAGLLLAILLVINGAIGVFVSPGSLAAFSSIAIGVVLGGVSVMYCLLWGPLNSTTDH